MPQSTEEIYELARARTDAPDLGFVEWPAFPWAVDGGRIVAKQLDPPTDVDREEISTVNKILAFVREKQ